MIGFGSMIELFPLVWLFAALLHAIPRKVKWNENNDQGQRLYRNDGGIYTTYEMHCDLS